MNFFYHGHWRMDWGLGNPNKTAILIVELALLSWSLVYSRKYFFWISLIVSSILGVVLITTYSRGGIVAALIGFIFLFSKCKVNLLKSQLIGVAGCAILLICFSYYFEAGSRFVQGITQDDMSISNRLLIWKAAPRMMVDSPSGWGLGNSGNAYVQWYQPNDQFERYRTLVNSHLTWLVEFNWFERILYIQVWILMLILIFPQSGFNQSLIPFCILLAFGVGSFFSSVAECVWLWIIPTACIFFVFWNRFKECIWPSKRFLINGIIFGFLIVFSFLIAGYFTPRTLKITGTSSSVHIRSLVSKNSKHSKLWIFSPDPKIIGDFYGHALRKGFDSLSYREIIVSSTLEEISNLDCMVAMADVSRILKTSYFNLLILNPTVKPPNSQTFSGLHVVWGEFRQSSDRAAWESCLHQNDDTKFIEAQGAAEYIPDWVEYLK